VLARLLRSREPSIRLKARLRVLGEDPESRPIRALREAVRKAPRSRALVAVRNRPGRRVPPGVYHKWLGAHWALATLADLEYPSEDPRVRPAVETTVRFWLREYYYREVEVSTRREAERLGSGVPRVNGRYRRCGSQQGNALFAATRLGWATESCDRLAERLLHWQWPDGGWNCDKDPDADTSSFMETLTPMAGLWEYGTAHRKPEAVGAARRASEVFLKRHLYRRVANGAVIRGEFLRWHYPLYYHYDVLGGLKVLARMGQVNDPRCSDALDLLEAKELGAGGWSSGGRYYDLPGEPARKGHDRVTWHASPRGMNEWITVDALAVLAAAGRYAPAR
jgi:hypothetical protein